MRNLLFGLLLALAPALRAADAPAPPVAATPPATSATSAAGPTNATHATVATSVPAPPVPGAPIRFDFAGMPYGDALQRFAQMTGKPLITDAPIEGTLSFTDPRPYTYAEALDTLNLVLATKNVMLVEDDRYLRLVPFKQIPQMPLRILRGLENVGQLRPGEIVTVILDLKNLDAGELSQPITSLLSTAGSVAPLSRGRGLILTDRLANIQRVKELLTQIDIASPVQRDLKTYTLRNASGTLLSDLINRTFGQATAPKRTVFNEQRKAYEVLPPDPTDYITAVFAEASSTLVLFGPSGRIELADQLIQRFENQGDARSAEVRIIYPQMAPDELAGMIRQAIPGVAARNETGPEAFTKAKVIPDVSGSRLIVAAPAASQMEAITTLIRRLDPAAQDSTVFSASATNAAGSLAPGNREMRLVEIKSASAQALAPMLREALADLGRGPAGPTPLSQVRLQPSPIGNRLLLTGTHDALDEVTRLLEQLDTVNDRAEVTRVFRLKFSNASRVASMIMSSYGGPDGRRRYGFVAAAAEDRVNAVIVGASSAQMKNVEELVSRLEEVNGQVTRKLEVIEVAHNSAASLAAMVTQLYSSLFQSGDPNTRVVLTASPDDRSLVIEAEEPMIQRVREAVAALDVEPTVGSFEVRTYPLPEGRAADLTEALNRLFAEISSRRRAGTPGPPPPRFELERTTDTLIVAATPEQFVPIDKLLADLRAASAMSSQIRTFRLAQAEPAQVIEVLLSMLLGDDSQRWRNARGWRGGTGTAEIRIAAANAINAVVVQASPEKLAIASQLIETLDRPRTDATSTLQTVNLRQANAEAVAAAVTQTLAARPGDTSRNLTVTAVPGGRSILVSGPAAEVQKVIQIIRELDVDNPSGRSETKVFKLQNGKARELSRVLEELLDGFRRTLPRPPGRPQPRDAYTITPDERTNTLLVTASPDYFKLIDQLLPTLDQAPERSDRQIQFYWLRNADPVDVSFRLEALFRDRPRAERPVIDYDWSGSSLTVIARPTDLAQIEEAIQKLDVSVRDTSIQVRMVTLNNVPAERVANVLTNIYSQTREGVIQVVDRLPTPTNAPPSSPRTRTVPAPAEAAPGASTTNAPAIPPVVIAINRDANALILSGPVSELDHIQSMISDLSASFTTPEFEIRQFRLREADPVVIAQVLNELFRPLPPGAQIGANAAQNARRFRARSDGDSRPAPQGAQAQPTVPKVAVVAESRTHSIIVRARPADFELLESIIQQLDAGGLKSELAHRMVALEHTTPERVIPLVRQMLGQFDAVRPGERAAIASDPRSRSLFLVGREGILDQIVALIRELDTPSEFSELEIRSFPLRAATAAPLAALLRNMFRPDSAGELTAEARQLQEQVSRLKLAGLDGQPIGLDLTQPIKIIADPPQPSAGGANRLLIASTPPNLAALAAVVELLDTPSANGLDSFRIFKLQHADAATLQRLLAELTPSQARPDERATLSVDDRSNSLIATGTEKTLAVVARLIEQLDQDLPAGHQGIRILPLQHAEASTLASSLQRLLDERARMRGGRRAYQGSDPNRVVIIPDPRSNALLVAASPENFELIQTLLQQLDQPPSALLGQIRFVPLQHADAQAIASTLGELFQRRAQNARNPELQRSRPVLLADSRSNALLVTASPDDNAIIDDLIRRLDTVDYSAAGNIQLFPLKHARASLLATVLDQFFRSKRNAESIAGNRERILPVTITADDRSNTLLVTGGKDAFASVERMIQQLDTEKTFARTTFRVVELRHATAAKIQATLNRLFSNRPSSGRGEPTEPVTVIADPWSNSLILGGIEDDVALAASLVERLDVAQPEGGSKVQVFPLAKADARRLESTLQSLFRNGPGTFSGGAPSVAINIDERLNAIIVSAGEADLQRMEELLRKLDTDQVARVAEIRIFPLKNGRAAEMALVLNNVVNTNPRQLTDASPNRQSLLQFIAQQAEGSSLVTSALKEGIIIVPDPRANSLVVSAPVDYMDLLNEMIRHLDETAPTVAQIKVFNLRNADARQMAQVLTTLFRLQSRGYASANQQTIEYTMPRDPASAGPAPAPAPATPGAPAPAPSGAASPDGAVVGSAQEDALTVTVDLRTNSLLVGGTEHYVSLASQIIETLDEAPGQERKAEVIRLKNSRAQAVETSLRTFLQQDLQRITTILGPQGVGTAQNILDREVSIVSETNANSLLISASPRYFGEVRQLVEQLDLPQPQVLIQVLLAEVTLDSKTDLGVEWNLTKGNDPTVSTGTDFAQQAALQAFGGYWATVTGNNYRFMIRALQNEGRLEVLSRPQILTADNQEATINIGKRVPLVTDSRVTPQGDTINQFTYENVGVLLRVVPRISPDGFVKMDLSPSISDLSSSTIDISKDVSVPIINQRTATTAVTVKSGQSVLLGGLIGTIDDIRTKKVPWLGDIPGLGALFRSRAKARDRKELLIVLTPQVLTKGIGDGKTIEAGAFTRQELDASDIKDQIERDALRSRILDPIYPPSTNTPPAADKKKRRR